MSDNVEVLLVGAGYMAKEYYKVLQTFGADVVVVGRGEESASRFEQEMGCKVLRGGIEQALSKLDVVPAHAIVAVDVNALKSASISVMDAGVRHLLIEKPAGMNRSEIEEIVERKRSSSCEAYVAYNRRFYAATLGAEEIIEADGGVQSFLFEFTEWGHVIAYQGRPKEVLDAWFMSNPSHVADLAFHLGGFPKEMASYASGGVAWHSAASVYAGAGVTDKGCLFSYSANWGAPGRWAVEVLTSEHRLYFKPMEKLQIQNLKEVSVSEVPLDYSLDTQYKPGLYRMLQAFFNGERREKLPTIEDQLEHMDVYERIECVN